MTALILKKGHAGERLHAVRRYRPGEVVFDFEQVAWRPARDRHTVEHPFGGHIFHPTLAKVSHSCDPNCRISFPYRAVVAIRSIEPGELISVDYQSTEHSISHPFDCLCGAPRCRGRIE